MVAPILSEADHAKVSAAVSAAEAHTAGEIVTIVTDRSDGYSDIALAWAAFAAATALLVFSLFPSFFLAKIEALTGGWGTEWTPAQLLGLALALVTTKFLGVLLVQLWHPLKFWLIPGAVKSRRVLQRAITCFKVGAERRTHGRTGILIYLSLREHRAEIVADAAIVDKVAPEVWGEAMAAMLVEIRAGRLPNGLIAAVGEVGKVLTEHFPRAGDDTNELPDRLIEV